MKKYILVIIIFLFSYSLFPKDANASNWEIEVQTDYMTDYKIITFYLSSKEKGVMDYSYLIVKYDSQNFDISIVWNNMKMVLDTHKVLCTFDDGIPKEYMCNNSIDFKSSLIPYNEVENFIYKLKNSKKLEINGSLYGGSVKATFNIEGFNEVYKKYMTIYKP